MKSLLNYLTANLDRSLFIKIYTGFIIATIAGTLLHESGHWLSARIMGVNAKIHYGSCSYYSNDSSSVFARFQNYMKEHSRTSPNDSSYQMNDEYRTIVEEIAKFRFIFILGGPLQTLSTSAISLFLLFLFRKRFDLSASLKLWQWLLVFGALFSLRQPANLIALLVNYIQTGFISTRGDEIRLAFMLGLPWYSLIGISSIAGALALAIVLYKFIPFNQRLTFLAGGFLGGISGYVFWLQLVGPIVLP